MSTAHRASSPAGRPLLVDFKSPLGTRVTEIRSTLIASSLTTLREMGFYDRYVELLPKEYHERILLTIAPEWLPVELGEVHYRTCDALELSDDVLERIGEAVSVRIMGTFLGTLVRASARSVGTSPWIVLSKYDVLWGRLWRGGWCSVEQVGPKDALIRSGGLPMYGTRYFRVAYSGILKGALGLFTRNVSVFAMQPPGDPTGIVAKLSWV